MADEKITAMPAASSFLSTHLITVVDTGAPAATANQRATGAQVIAAAVNAAPAGTVTSVSVVSANGFAGTVATASVTPAITLSTTVTGMLKGNGTAISAAAAGTDYVAPAAIRAKLTANTTINVPSQYANLELALAFAATIDFNGFVLVIQLAAGTYTPSATVYVIPVTVGQSRTGDLIIQGDTTTPSNVVLNSSVAFAGIVEIGAKAGCRIQGFKFTGGGNSFAIHASSGGSYEYANCEFSTGMFAAIASESGGTSTQVGPITVSAGMTAVIFAAGGGYAFQISNVITLSGTPAWIAGYAWADALGFVRVAGGTSFAGTGATGPRYAVQRNSVMDVSGAGATYLPGNAAGVTATGGLYS